jgi:hypothetical protein
MKFAGWRKAGQTRYGQQWSLSIGYYTDGQWFHWLSQELGSIKPKNDGRWEWTRAGIPGHPVWRNTKHEQGVCKTMQEARRKVEEGFVEDTQPARAG